MIADHLPGPALRADEARLRLALDVGELGTWTWDLDTGEGDIDERGARIVGLRPGDLVVTMGAGDIDLVARELARRRSGDKENRC